MADSRIRAAGAFIGIALSLGSCLNAVAQKGSNYTLSQLVDSAKRHLPALLQKQALVESAQAGITEARHSFLPQVNAVEELSVGSANDVAGPFLPVPGVLHSIAGSIGPNQNYQAVTGNMASLYAQYDLITFGLKSARVQNARASADLTRADLGKDQYVISWEIARLFFDILSRRNQLQVNEENVRRYQSMYDISVALTASGVNPGVDSSLARAGLARTRIVYNQSLGDLHRMQQQLTYLTGIATPNIDIDTSNVQLGWTVSKDSSNPLLHYYEQQKLQYQAQQLLAQKSYLPKVTLGAGGWARGTSTESIGLGYQRLNYVAGVGISYDLFNGTHRRDRLNVLNRQLDAANYALQQQQLSLNNQELQADENIRTARANLSELPAQLQAAHDAYDQKEAQYKAGIINLVDLLTASYELLQAQTGYIQTLEQWYTASLDKAATTGNLDQFIQTIK